MEPHQTVAALGGGEHPCLQASVAEFKDQAFPCLLAGTDHDFPHILLYLLEQQEFHVTAGSLPVAIQTCRQNTGIVEHQQIAGIEPVDDVMEHAFTSGAGLLIQKHDTGRIPGLNGGLGDQFFRQIEPEIRFFHVAGLLRKSMYITQIQNIVFCLAKKECSKKALTFRETGDTISFKYSCFPFEDTIWKKNEPNLFHYRTTRASFQ